MPITTSDIFTIDVVDALLVKPLFQRSVVLSSGLRRISTDSTRLYLPSVGNGQAGWFDDLDEIGDAGVTVSETLVVPKKVACLQLASLEAVDDANAAGLLSEALVAALADEVDRSFFLGTDPKGPDGITAFTGIGSVEASPTSGLDPYVDAAATIEAAGGTPSVIFMHPTDWAALSKIKTAAGSAMPLLSPSTAGVSGALSRQLFGIAVRVSVHVPIGTAWMVDADRVVVVDRLPYEVAVDRSAAFTKAGVYVRAIARLEFANPYGQAVVQIAAP